MCLDKGVHLRFGSAAMGFDPFRGPSATDRLFDVVEESGTTVEEVTQLIQEGADVNSTHWIMGDTPLSRAVQYGLNPEIIKLLIENGADANAADMLAAGRDSNYEVVKFLIENGADVNAANQEGLTPLMLAATAARTTSNPEIIRILIENGADVNAARTRTGETPLMLVAESTSNPEIIKIMIENGADVNAAERERGGTPLIIAAAHNPNPEVVKLLIENGADANAVDNANHKALHYATQNSALRGTEVHEQLRSLTTVGAIASGDGIEARLARIEAQLSRIEAMLGEVFLGEMW